MPDFYYLATGVSNTNPLVPSGTTAIDTGTKVLTNALRAVGSVGGFYITAAPTSTTMDASFTLLGTPNGDRIGVGMCTTAGDGFVFIVSYNDVRIRTVTAWAVGGYVTGDLCNAASGDVFKIQKTPTQLEVFLNGSSVGTYADTTSSLRPCFISLYENNNGIGATDVTFNYLTPVGTLDTVQNPSAVASTGNAGTTTGMAAITSLSFAGKSASVTSASVGTFAYTMPSFADGVSYPAMGAQTFSASDGTLTRTLAGTVSAPSGYTAVTMASINTGAWSLGSVVSPVITNGCVIFSPISGLNTDGTFTDVTFGTYSNFWLQDLSNVMHNFTFNVYRTDPNAFSFTDQTDVALSSVITSNTITPSGHTGATPISITGGTYSKAGGAYTSASGSLGVGETVTLRVDSSASFSTATSAVLTIGGVSDTFSVTTAAIDTTPTAFTFTDQTSVALSSPIDSNTITVAGINSAAAISISGGTYSKNSGSFTSSSDTVVASDTVVVRVSSSGSYNTAASATLTIGGVSDTFTVTTVVDDIPDAFTFTDITGAALSTYKESAAVTITGLVVASAITISNGQYSINGGSYTSSPGTITNGQSVTINLQSSATNSTAVNSVLTIGGVSDTFTVTTAADTNPNAFTFTDITNAVLGSSNTSNEIEIVGIDGETTLSLSNGTWSLNGGAFSPVDAIVTSGALIRVRLTASSSALTAVSGTLTVGAVSDTFTVTTANVYPTQFEFADIVNATESADYTSTITVAGISVPATISISGGGTYSINGGAYTSAAGTITNGQTATVKLTASSLTNHAVNTTLVIGGINDTFSVSTGPSIGGGVESSGRSIVRSIIH